MRPSPKQLRFAMRMHYYPSAERLSLMRNSYLSAGAVCLAILIALTQVNSRGLAFNVAVISGSIAMPLVFAVASIYESFILLGAKSYPFLRTRSAMWVITNLTVLGTGSVIVCVGSLLWILTPYAAGSFLLGAIAVKTVIRRFINEFSEWWYAETGPGDEEPNFFEKMYESTPDE
jgi:hypothetical protein